jgi:hypothetical protein
MCFTEKCVGMSPTELVWAPIRSEGCVIAQPYLVGCRRRVVGVFLVSRRGWRFATLTVIASAVGVVTAVGWMATGGATTPGRGAITTILRAGQILVGVRKRVVGCMVTAIGDVALLAAAVVSAARLSILVAAGPVVPRAATVNAAALLVADAAALRVAARRGAGEGCGVARVVGMVAASGNRRRDEEDAERRREEARGRFHRPTPNSKR